MASTTQVWGRPGPCPGAEWPPMWVYLREMDLPYVLMHPESGNVVDVGEFLAAQLRAPAFVARWQRWLRQQEQVELRSYISREAAKQECISVVVGDWQEDGADLLFVVEGDLYDGESAVLPIAHALTTTFPNVALDLMVLPAFLYDAEFRWGTASEVLYRRQQATT